MSIKYLDSTGIGKMFNLIKTALAGKQDTLTFDASPTSGSNNPVKSGGVYTALGNKQDTLTWDNAPTSASTNALASGKIYTALSGKQDSLTFDDTPTESSTNPVKSGGVYTALAGKQDSLTFDDSPTFGSNNPVKSGGIYNSILTHKHLITAKCTTAAGTGPKELTVTSGTYALNTSGDKYYLFAVWFKYGNGIDGECSIKLDNSSYPICIDGNMNTTTVRNYNAFKLWSDNEIVLFLFNGYNFIALKRKATDSVPGLVKISNSTTSSATDTAASSYALKLVKDAKQSTLTWDEEPTENSNNAMKSGAIYLALRKKADAPETTSMWTDTSTAATGTTDAFVKDTNDDPVTVNYWNSQTAASSAFLAKLAAGYSMTVYNGMSYYDGTVGTYGETPGTVDSYRIMVNATASGAGFIRTDSTKPLYVVNVSAGGAVTVMTTASMANITWTIYGRGDYAVLQTADAAPTSGSKNIVTSGGVYTALQNKQNTLTFDSAPTQNSTNPVTSGGVYTAIQNAGGGGGSVTVDSSLSSTSENPVQNKVIYVALGNKQDALTFDSSPTSGSSNPVKSKGIYTALAGKADNTLSQPLIASGGDGASAGKIALDHTASGQITDESTSTIFGFLSNNATNLTVGGSGYGMSLRGSGDRPTYTKGSGTAADLAKYSDLPTNPLTLSNKSGYDCNTRYDGKIWLIGSGSNCPSGSQYGALFTLPYRQASGNSKPDYGAQIFLPNGDDSTKPNSMFYRTSLENSWNAWKEVAVEGACNADKVDGYHISVVSALPASPDANTIYIVT